MGNILSGHSNNEMCTINCILLKTVTKIEVTDNNKFIIGITVIKNMMLTPQD
jgi:hypothetical protein